VAFPKKCKESECPYHADRGEVPYDGPTATELIIVGESPGFEENRIGRPFSGISGRFLMALLRHIGLERDEVLLTNAARCRIDKDKDSIKNQNLALKTCRKKLERVIHNVRPRVIVALGGVALRQLTGKQKIMENRGKFFDSPEFDCKIFATVHPAWILRQGARDGFWDQPIEKMSATERILFMDFEQVQKYLKDPSIAGINTERYTKGRKSDLAKLKAAEVLAVDFETNGLDIESPNTRILSIGFSAEEGKSIVFLPKRDGSFPEPVLQLLSDPNITKIVAARPFEERCAVKLGHPMPGDTVHDVLSMAHVLDENFSGGYSLEKVADLYTGLKNIKSIAQGMRANLEEVDKETLVKYNGVDCDATLRAFHIMRRMLSKDPALANYYTHFTQKMQSMFADLHHNGCLIDTEALGRGERELEAIAEASEREALRLIPTAITTEEKHEGKLRLSRDALVRDYLFTHPEGKRLTPNPKYLTPKKKEPQITEDHLKQFRGRFIENYLRMKKAKKILSTYLKKLWVQMHHDGRVYPDTIFTRTVTGRTVMVNPAIQTIPQRGEFAKHVKKAFVADPGWVMGARDLSQSEIRIVGWLAQDPNILGALAANVDVHTKTAAIINKVPIEQVTKDMRQKAKACIAEGELVSVKSPNGWFAFVPIEKVERDMKVWDGQEWVSHDGVIFQGEREVITYDGLTATPDHTVFLEAGGHCDFEQAKAEVRGIATGDAAFEGSWEPFYNGNPHHSRKAPKSPSPVPRMWKDKFPVGRQRPLWKNKELPLSERGEIQPGCESRCVGRPVRCYSSENYQSNQSLLAQLRWQGDQTEIQLPRILHFLDAQKPAPPDVQRCADRQTKQQRALRAGKPTIGFAVDEPHEQANQCEGPLQVCLDKCPASLARLEDDVSQVPVQQRVDQQVSEKGDVRGQDTGDGDEASVRRVVRVYDIRNAGPRHRFTVQGKIVSNCNFGFIYGMSAKKFQGYAKDEYGIELSLEQCEAVRQAFFAHPHGYYKLLDFHRKQESEAQHRGYVRSPIGRIRRLPNAQQSKDRMAMGEAFRQGINFPVQSFSSDLGLVGMWFFWKWVKKNNLEDKIKIMWFIHDAVVFQATAEEFPRAMRMLKYAMETMAVKYMKKHFDLDVGYPVASDGKAGSGWATLQEFCDLCGAVKMEGTCRKCRDVQLKAAEDAEKKRREETAAAGRTRIRRTLVLN